MPGHAPVCNLVAKLAFSEEQQTRLTNEARLYERLMEHGVTSVPKFYGLFQDTQRTVAVILLENVGELLTEKPEFAHPTKEKQHIIESPYKLVPFVWMKVNGLTIPQRAAH